MKFNCISRPASEAQRHDAVWDLDLSSVQIVGDGIGSSKKIDDDHRTEHDYLKVGNRGRQSVKRAAVQTGTRLCIDPQVCATWAKETLTDGWCSFDDIETLLAFCEGNGDPFDLRTNIERILEAAGIDIFDLGSCYDAGVWDAKSEICADDLAEAIEAALTRSMRLPGTQLFVMDKSDELQLLEPMIRAKQELQLAILASEAAVEKILDTFASIRDGARDPGSVTLRMIIPARPDHTETAEVFSAVEALNYWRGNGRVMDGKRRREALAALEALDFSLLFYKELVRSVEEADTSGELTSRLYTQISGLDIVVNNAFSQGEPGRAIEAPLHVWRDVLDVNLLGPLGMTQAATPALIRRGGGSIIMVSSDQAWRVVPGFAALCRLQARSR